eukprot:1143771-Pyramimonas_sp.AAC.1
MAVDLRGDSGREKLTGGEADEIKLYGLRGCTLLRRGNAGNVEKALRYLDSLRASSSPGQVKLCWSGQAMLLRHGLLPVASTGAAR